MQKIIFVILVLAFCLGRTAAIDAADFNNEVEIMNLSDGVNKSEAITIAQNEMIKRNISKQWNIKKPKVLFDTNDEWGIRFYPKVSIFKMAPPLKFLVVIKKNDGEITYFGEDK